MRKKMFFVLFAVFCLGLVLIGCGGKDGGSEEPTQTVTVMVQSEMSEIDESVEKENEDNTTISSDNRIFEEPFELIGDQVEISDTIVYFLIDNSKSMSKNCVENYCDQYMIPTHVLDIFQNMSMDSFSRISNINFAVGTFGKDLDLLMDFTSVENLATSNVNWYEDLQKKEIVDDNEQLPYDEIINVVTSQIDEFVDETKKVNTNIILVLITDGTGDGNHLTAEMKNIINQKAKDLDDWESDFKSVKFIISICPFTKDKQETYKNIFDYWAEQDQPNNDIFEIERSDCEEKKNQLIEKILKFSLADQNEYYFALESDNCIETDSESCIKIPQLSEFKLQCYEFNNDNILNNFDCKFLSFKENNQNLGDGIHKNLSCEENEIQIDKKNSRDGFVWAFIEPIQVKGKFTYSEIEDYEDFKLDLSIEDDNYEHEIGSCLKCEIKICDPEGKLKCDGIDHDEQSCVDKIKLNVPQNNAQENDAQDKVYLSINLYLENPRFEYLNKLPVKNYIFPKQISSLENSDTRIYYKDMRIDKNNNQDNSDLNVLVTKFKFEDTDNFTVNVGYFAPNDENIEDVISKPLEGETEDYVCYYHRKSEFFPVIEYSEQGLPLLESKNKNVITYKIVPFGTNSLEVEVYYLRYLQDKCNYGDEIYITFVDGDQINRTFSCNLKNGHCEYE